MLLLLLSAAMLVTTAQGLLMTAQQDLSAAGQCVATARKQLLWDRVHRVTTQSTYGHTIITCTSYLSTAALCICWSSQQSLGTVQP